MNQLKVPIKRKYITVGESKLIGNCVLNICANKNEIIWEKNTKIMKTNLDLKLKLSPRVVCIKSNTFPILLVTMPRFFGTTYPSK